MNSSVIDQLNSRFGIADRVSFEFGPGGFVFANLKCAAGSATLSLHGAHVTAFKPEGQEPVIWTSPDAVFAPEKAIRGGIPVCWPWFADHPDDPEKPAHGVARTSLWKVISTTVTDQDATSIELELPSAIINPVAEGIELKLSITVTATPVLELKLTTTNSSNAPCSFTEALHTYLHVGEIEKVRIEGLDGVRYLDKVENNHEKKQEGDVYVAMRTDRIYQDTTSDILVDDTALNRLVRIGKTGSNTTVVWNPWSAIAEKMTDFPDTGYRHMVCVEATNAAKNIVTLDPGEQHCLGTTISVE